MPCLNALNLVLFPNCQRRPPALSALMKSPRAEFRGVDPPWYVAQRDLGNLSSPPSFLFRGATQYGEAGVLMTFEETVDDITKNVASLGFDVTDLKAKKKLLIDHVQVNSNDIEENGEYDLGGLFIRLAYAIDTIGARRVVLDTIETLFSGFKNQGILRSEVRRLFGWLKERGMTAIITAERGEGQLTGRDLKSMFLTASFCSIIEYRARFLLAGCG